MKRIARLPATLALAMLFSTSCPGGDLLVAAATNAAPAAIGVYDSRVLAYAHFWSAPHQRHLAELSAAVKAAKAAGQTGRFHELEAALKGEQERIHLQVFSTAPADDALAEIKDRVSVIQKEAGVATLISKWDEPRLKKHPRSNQMDVTELLLREFALDEKKLKVARDLAKKQPLPLETARELLREGKL